MKSKTQFLVDILVVYVEGAESVDKVDARLLGRLQQKCAVVDQKLVSYRPPLYPFEVLHKEMGTRSWRCIFWYRYDFQLNYLLECGYYTMKQLISDMVSLLVDLRLPAGKSYKLHYNKLLMRLFLRMISKNSRSLITIFLIK